VEEYLGKIVKLGPNDVVSGSTFNKVIEQLQHNIDLLYRSQASAVQNWNISELLFGNLMDYDQTGVKSFVNGGRIDSLEKVRAFTSTVGTLSYEETTVNNWSEWLRWDIPFGIVSNIQLIRNIVVPEALRHQAILIAFKIHAAEGNTPVYNERFEIYINKEYAGTAETGIQVVNGLDTDKTLYGVYHLTGQESNLEIALVRSVTNHATYANYTIRVSNVFVGLHSLGNSSFSLNFPVSGSSFIGAGADINAFYDFENNSIRVIPSFLINSEQLEGNGTLTVNITAQSPNIQSDYYLGTVGTGNQTGSDASNLMSATTFFNISNFQSNNTNVYIAQDGVYPNFTFNNGTYEVNIPATVSAVYVPAIQTTNGTSVKINIDPNATSTKITVPVIELTERSRLDIEAIGSKKVKFLNDWLSSEDNSLFKAKVGTYTGAISGSTVLLTAGSIAYITIASSTFVDADGQYGFGMSIGPVTAQDHSSLNINCLNTMNLHVGTGVTSFDIEENSSVKVSGFTLISTSSTNKTLKARKNSNFYFDCPIQTISGGATSFTNIDLAYNCSLGTVSDVSSLTQNISGYSTVYSI
jgi:hypothetical protein